MSEQMLPAIANDREHREEYEQEIDWTLHAIAGAIAAGTLTPDDAFAWAKIAVSEVKALYSRPMAARPTET